MLRCSGKSVPAQLGNAVARIQRSCLCNQITKCSRWKEHFEISYASDLNSARNFAGIREFVARMFRMSASACVARCECNAFLFVVVLVFVLSSGWVHGILSTWMQNASHRKHTDLAVLELWQLWLLHIADFTIASLTFRCCDNLWTCCRNVPNDRFSLRSLLRTQRLSFQFGSVIVLVLVKDRVYRETFFSNMWTQCFVQLNKTEFRRILLFAATVKLLPLFTWSPELLHPGRSRICTLGTKPVSNFLLQLPDFLSRQTGDHAELLPPFEATYTVYMFGLSEMHIARVSRAYNI